eukprot:g58884.t1
MQSQLWEKYKGSQKKEYQCKPCLCSVGVGTRGKRQVLGRCGAGRMIRDADITMDLSTEEPTDLISPSIDNVFSPSRQLQLSFSSYDVDSGHLLHGDSFGLLDGDLDQREQQSHQNGTEKKEQEEVKEQEPPSASASDLEDMSDDEEEEQKEDESMLEDGQENEKVVMPQESPTTSESGDAVDRGDTVPVAEYTASERREIAQIKASVGWMQSLVKWMEGELRHRGLVVPGSGGRRDPNGELTLAQKLAADLHLYAQENYYTDFRPGKSNVVRCRDCGGTMAFELDSLGGLVARENPRRVTTLSKKYTETSHNSCKKKTKKKKEANGRRWPRNKG